MTAPDPLTAALSSIVRQAVDEAVREALAGLTPGAADDLHGYTILEVAERLRCSPTTVNVIIRSGRLRTVTLGGERRVPASALRAFLEAPDPQATSGSQPRATERVRKLA